MERNTSNPFSPLLCCPGEEYLSLMRSQNGEEQSKPGPGREEECVNRAHSSPHVLTDTTSSKIASDT